MSISTLLAPETLAGSLAQVSLSSLFGGSGGEGGGLVSMLPIVLMFVILYFLMIRPQMKRQKELKNMIAALGKGDEIVTSGGVLGKITKVNETYISLEVGQTNGAPVEVLIQRAAVQTVLPKGTIKAL